MKKAICIKEYVNPAKGRITRLLNIYELEFIENHHVSVAYHHPPASFGVYDMNESSDIYWGKYFKLIDEKEPK
jgi:hypothetical protein